MLTKIRKHGRTIALRLREDRGDLLVTPTVILGAMALTALLGGLAYYGTQQVAPRVNNARQGITLDDEGNVVQGAVGIIPVATPKPTPEPTEAPPKVITRTRIIERDPEPEPQHQPPAVVYVSPGDSSSEPHDSGDSHTSNTSNGTTSGGGGDTGGGGHGGGGGTS